MKITIKVSQEASEDMRFNLVQGTEKPNLGQVAAAPGAMLFSGPKLAELSWGKSPMPQEEDLRKAGAALAKWLKTYAQATIQLDTSALPIESSKSAVFAFCEGFLLGGFQFDSFKSTPKDHDYMLTVLGDAGLQEAIDRAVVISEGTNLARELGQTPANHINPASLAEICKQIADDNGLGFKVLDDKELLSMKAGAIYSVGQGSQTGSRLIVMEYPGTDPGLKPVVLVGKAITFDTGGYSLKTKEGMLGMKLDKCGGVNVVAVMQTVARLKLKTPVVGLIAAAENMVSKEAYRPSDIIRSLSGKTIEIISTDAEGRLVMCDALTYAQREYQAQALIDIATLTGGVVVSLGSVRAGLFGNDAALKSQFCQAGDRVFERLWELPMDEEYFELIKGTDSDIKNSAGVPVASAIQGGLFLKQFIEEGTAWAHIDIAGTGMSKKTSAYAPKGATGFGVRLLTEYISTLA